MGGERAGGHRPQTIRPFEEKERLLFEELLQVGRSYPEELWYINGIFIHYFYYLRFKDHPAEKNARQPILMEEICSYIEQKIYAKLSVQEVADFFQISTRRLHQIFQQSCGMSPKQYISSRKIEKAKQILCTIPISVTDLSALLGYDSAYHFSASFKKLVGCPPSVFRKRCAKAAEPSEDDEAGDMEIKK